MLKKLTHRTASEFVLDTPASGINGQHLHKFHLSIVRDHESRRGPPVVLHDDLSQFAVRRMPTFQRNLALMDKKRLSLPLRNG